MALTEGKAAPAFKLKNQDGEDVALADFKGKTVVLFAYPKAMTSGCTVEAREFSELALKFSKKGAVVLGISADKVESQKRFEAKECLTVPLLSDPDAAYLKKIGFFGEKTLYGRKYDGIFRRTAVIDGAGKVRKVFENVKAKGHAAQVLEFLSGG